MNPNSNQNGYSIHHDLVIQSSIEKVFEAVTTPSHLENWWPLKCSGEAKLGEVYNFYFTDEYDWFGKVMHVEANKSFHIQMTESDEDWNPTRFGFDLEEIDQGVWVKFWHVGWPSCNDHFRRSSFCWAILLKGLKDYLEKGIIIPFEERE